MSAINKFLDRVRSAESRNQREIVMTINEARDLHSDLTKLLLALHESAAPRDTANVSDGIEITGGDF